MKHLSSGAFLGFCLMKEAGEQVSERVGRWMEGKVGGNWHLCKI